MASHDDNVPEQAGFQNFGDPAEFNTAWGLATTGIPLFNAISGDGVDPFYPAIYERVLVKQWAVE